MIYTHIYIGNIRIYTNSDDMMSFLPYPYSRRSSPSDAMCTRNTIRIALFPPSANMPILVMSFVEAEA